jgi:hypothetical protein
MEARAIEEVLRSLTHAQVTNLGVEVTTHVLLPGGNAVTVVVAEHGGHLLVHDASAGSMHLSSCGIAISRSLLSKLEETVAAYGCFYSAGRISLVVPAEQLPAAIVLVANASRAVGDHAPLAHSLRTSRFYERVAETLTGVLGDRVRSHQEVVADSGRTYRIGHVVLDANRDKPIAFVEAVADKESVPRRVAEFLDLGDEYADVKMEAVYDDSHDWPSGHLILLKKVANPVPFTKWDSRARAIARAA